MKCRDMKCKIIMALLVICIPGCAERVATKSIQKKLPKDLMYNGKPISDTSMNAVFGLGGSGYKVPGGLNLGELESENCNISEYCNKFEWQYIGSFDNGYHVVYGYEWPKDAMGKFSGIFVLKREKDNLIVIDEIGGGDRHSTMITTGSLEKNQLTYCKNMTDGSLIDSMVYFYPELEPLFKKKNNWSMHYGEGDFIGVAQFVVDITTEGKIINERMTAFYSSYYKDEEMKEALQEPSLATLDKGDAIQTALDLYCSQQQCQKLTGNELKNVFKQAMHYTENRT